MPSDGDGELPEAPSVGRYRDRILSGPIFRTIAWLGLPPLLNQLIVVAYNVTDAYWLSLYSDFAVAVPRQTWPIIMLLHALLQALNVASLSIVSQYVGGKLYREASQSASKFFTLSLLSGGMICTIFLSLKEFIFTEIISTPPEIYVDVAKYSTVISFDIFLSYISLTFVTLLQSIGDTRRPSMVNMAAFCLNMLLDPFFVLGLGPFPRLGVVGAAITDVMGKVVSLSALLYILKKNYPDVRITFTRDIDLSWISLVARVGLPVLVLNLTNSLALITQLRIINTLGIAATTAYSIGFVVIDIIDVSLWGLSSATAIVIGQSLGAGDTTRASEAAYKSALLLFISVALGASLIYPFKTAIINVFTDDPVIAAETDTFLQILLPSLPFFGLFIVAMSVGRGSGRTLAPTLIGIFRLWGIRVGLGYFLVFIAGMGSLGAWLAIAISNFLGGIVSFFWIKYGDWRKPMVRRAEFNKN